jgi:hypothetical protein
MPASTIAHRADDEDQGWRKLAHLFPATRSLLASRPVGIRRDCLCSANITDDFGMCFEFMMHVDSWAGPPACAGWCPPDNPICADVAGTCTCVAP